MPTAVLEGSIRKSGSRVRVMAQLVDPATAQPIWTERYDRELTDLFRTQEEIAKSIVRSVRKKLAAVSPVLQEVDPVEAIYARFPGLGARLLRTRHPRRPGQSGHLRRDGGLLCRRGRACDPGAEATVSQGRVGRQTSAGTRCG